MYAARVSVNSGGRAGGRWKADGSSTRPSTVSSRIALLPANVCHVWHTRCAPRRTRPLACASAARSGATRVRVRAQTLAIARARFSRCRREHARTLPIATSIARRHTLHIALPCRTHDTKPGCGSCETRRKSRINACREVKKIWRVNFCQATRRGAQEDF